MAILEGTTEDGALVPVQVTDAGRVVAEGLDGPEGPQGPQGEKGDKGDKGDPGSPGDLWSGTDPGDIHYDGGNVGIGTTDPVDRLHVEGGGMRLEEDGGVTISYREATTGSAELVFRDAKAAANRLRIDPAGRLLIGSDSTQSISNVDGKIQVQGTGSDSSIAVKRNSNNEGGPYISLGKSRGTGVNQNTIVESGDDLGGILFSGADGDDTASLGASIIAEVDGTPGSNNMPGRLVFSTTNNGSPSPTVRMTIDSQGDVIFQGAPIIRSPDGTHWAIEVDNSGNLSAIQAI